jgi:SAM-dependent methyltransferase
VQDDEQGLYGRNYFAGITEEYRSPSPEERARGELTERGPYWLRALMRRKSPPGRVLELGCRYGGFVALLRAAGFDATGLELSPGLADDARRRFDIPMLTGPLESQKIVPGSLDAVVLMDVMERLRNPAETIRTCLNLLKGDGIFLIRTPRYPEAVSLRTMQQLSDPFLQRLEHEQHLYLFSRSSIELLFRRLGVPHVEFEPAICGHEDMLLAAGRTALANFSDEQIASVLAARPSGRLALALIDMDGQRRHLQNQVDEFLGKGTSVPLERTIWRLKHSYVFRAMRMLGLWEWLDTGFDGKAKSLGATGRPSQESRQGKRRGD